MATSTLVPLQVYLETDYRPDLDWIEALTVPGTEIRVTLAEVFAELDELEGGRVASST